MYKVSTNTRTLTLALIGCLLLTPYIVSAQTVTSFLTNVLSFINNALIPFILGIGFLIFVWGIFNYFIVGGANEEKRAQGKSLLIYAIIGFVVIIIFWGLVNVLASGIGGETDRITPPTGITY